MEIIEKIELIKSLFKCREDVFAIRWDKGNKSAYMPAYNIDPYHYKIHRMKGGNFKDYSSKQYRPLTNNEIEKHLLGLQFIGIYPLLKDNSSYFIVADFDKDNWVEECVSFVDVCNRNGIYSYLERSQSGKGGHVWMFFEQSYPAYKSRSIVLNLLEFSGSISKFDRNVSFDRLFPNQNYLSGKGFGNLIALPLNKKFIELGNCCFIDLNSNAYNNQWDFLISIKRNAIKHLDDLYRELTINTNKITPLIEHSLPYKIKIQLNNKVCISNLPLPSKLINFLKEELNFVNSEYLIKKKLGKNTWGTEYYFKQIEETDKIFIPRGFIGRLIRFCKENNLNYEFIDERLKLPPIQFNCNIVLRDEQKPAIDASIKKDFGIIVAPPGLGKTIIALNIIALKQQKALVIVHRKQIAEQWVEKIKTFLDIPKNEIGIIGQGKAKVGKSITVAIIKSLTKWADSENEVEKNKFGIIVIDECHHIASKTFRDTVSKIPTYYLYGLTATPFRKYNDQKLIFSNIGEIIVSLQSQIIENDNFGINVIIRNTQFNIPYNSKTDNFEILSKSLIYDSTRNKLILNDVILELKKNKKVIIITERKEHIDSLYQYLKRQYEVITLSGNDNDVSRNIKWQKLKEGDYQILITTGQLLGEGTDLQNAETLFLVYPFSFHGKLIQYIGRVQRIKLNPTIYDYRDYQIKYLDNLFLKRNAYYKKISKTISLFDHTVFQKDKQNIIIDRIVKVSIQELDFKYGCFSFNYQIEEIKEVVDFNIYNNNIRPEFEVLKVYFIKVLKTKVVEVNIYAEFKDGKLITKLANSEILEKINDQIIEGVKFKFITSDIITKPFETNNLLDINNLQSNKGSNCSKNIYNSEELLLKDILKNNKYKHYRQLVYLSDNHIREILKIRFVLSPFSFIFILKGKYQYHIIWETLDTEEATYIWHFDNNVNIEEQLENIEEQLSIIRNKGRQYYIKNHTENFSRIQHNYSNEQKGFIIWKCLLEENLS